MAKKDPSRRPPKWVLEFANKCKQAFGLWNWDIRLTLTPDLEFEGDPAKGVHTSNYRTLTSRIEFHPDILENDEGCTSITHEMLHVALMEHFIAFERALDFVPSKHRKHCRRLFKDAEEHTVEHLARSLTPMLLAVKPGEEKQ